MNEPKAKEKITVSPLPRFIASVSPVSVTVSSEPYILWSIVGYVPIVNIMVNNVEHYMFINSLTLSKGLRPKVDANGGKWLGITAVIKRVAEGRFAPYEVS